MTALNILLVSNVLSPLSADDQWVSDRLTAAGHTVTTQLDSATPSFAGRDLVIFCRNCSQAHLGTQYDSTNVGVLALGGEPHSLYSSGSVAQTGSQTSVYVLTNGDVLAFGQTGTVTVTTIAGTMFYFIDTTLGGGCVKVLAQSSGAPSRVIGSRYEIGAALSDGSTTTQSRRCQLSLPTGYANGNSVFQGMFDTAVNWAATGLTAKPSDKTVHVRSTVALSGTASGVTGTASWSWNHVSGPSTNATLSSTATQNPTYVAPNSAATPDVWSLTVTDSATGQSSLASNCTITYLNDPPAASAGGPYTQQATGTPNSMTVDVNLNGTASSDPEGGALTYSWRVITSSAASATLFNPATSTPTLRIDKYGGITTIGNTVTDTGGVVSAESTTIVTVYPVAYKWFTHNGVLVKRQRFTAHNGVLV